jgi:hypothetical protein
MRFIIFLPSFGDVEFIWIATTTQGNFCPGATNRQFNSPNENLFSRATKISDEHLFRTTTARVAFFAKAKSARNFGVACLIPAVSGHRLRFCYCFDFFSF